MSGPLKLYETHSGEAISFSQRRFPDLQAGYGLQPRVSEYRLSGQPEDRLCQSIRPYMCEDFFPRSEYHPCTTEPVLTPKWG